MATVTRTTDPYELLGVDRQAGADSIKAAYRKLALDCHPDRNPGDKQAEERFKEISQAYATLRDPEARARYDRFGQVASASGGAPDFRAGDFSTVDWQTLFREADIHISRERWQGVPQGGGVQGAGAQGGIMFQALFGVMTGLMRQSGLLPGEDRETVLRLGLEEARAGLERRVRVPGPSLCAACRGSGREGGAACLHCGGEGVLRAGTEVDVTVPAGVAPGAKLRLRGLGGPGNPPGDAYVHIDVTLPAGAALEGGDLYVDLPLLPQEAARGTEARRYGVSVRVPPGSKDGDRLRLTGQGLAGGDLIFSVRVGLWRGALRRVAEMLS
ncbi:molecular chaperone DnaJ [soil metagenome]|jgi:DnaJ-class molecular chaperone|nr:DnaJ domain-containing protein [Deinococcota bacterium]